MSANQLILKRTALGTTYLDLLDRSGFTLVDMNMIEPFSIEDKNHHPTSIVFERDSTMYAIRSDWTRTLLNFNNNYYSNDTKFGYFGPVVREHESFYQAGVEIYKASNQDIINTLLMHIQFVENSTEDTIKTFVINNDQLLDLFIDKYKLSENVRTLVYSKNISELRHVLGTDHDLYKIISAKVSEQYGMIQQLFGDTEIMQLIERVKDVIKSQNKEMKFILDLSFRSPQKYYNGLYFQAFLNANSPVLSGGQYNSSAFGIGLNLSDGGLL